MGKTERIFLTGRRTIDTALGIVLAVPVMILMSAVLCVGGALFGLLAPVASLLLAAGCYLGNWVRGLRPSQRKVCQYTLLCTAILSLPLLTVLAGAPLWPLAVWGTILLGLVGYLYGPQWDLLPESDAGLPQHDAVSADGGKV